MSVMYPDYCPMCGERDLAVRLEAKFDLNEDYCDGMVGRAHIRKGFLHELA